MLSKLRKIFISNEAGTDSVKVTNSGLDVNIQDQHTPLVNVNFAMATGTPSTLNANVAKDDLVCVVVDATGIDVGDYVGIFNVAGERYFFAEVLIKVTNTLTLDTPFDFAFQSGDLVVPTTRDLNVDGSGTTQVFQVTGPSGAVEIDITRIIFTMTLSSLGDDALFGNIDKLTNGLVLRKTDGTTRNIFNVKDNGELAGISYDMQYTTRSGGGGSYGLRCRYTFSGQSKQGVTVRLAADEQLELLVQDNLLGINRLRVVAEGHEVE